MLIRGQDAGSFVDSFNTTLALPAAKDPSKALPPGAASIHRPTLNDIRLKFAGSVEHEAQNVQPSGYFTHRMSLAERGARMKVNQTSFMEDTRLI
jgi:hypothetical protein